MKSGILVIDKPLGISTNNVIQQVKRKLNIKKVGHAGTLDPLATGVVIVLINNGTKISDYLLNANKRYQVTMELFKATSTYDREGEITEQQNPFSISLDDVNKVIKKFNGYNYDQKPPIFSAIKIKGKKLYEYALENKEVEIVSRNITINALSLLEFNSEKHTISLDVICTKGTYIRSLVVDIAKELGTISHVSELRRIMSGNFNIKKSKTIEEVGEDDILSIKDSLKLNDMKIIKYNNIQDVLFGKKIILKEEKEDLIFIKDENQNIIALYEREKEVLFRCKRGGLNNPV